MAFPSEAASHPARNFDRVRVPSILAGGSLPAFGCRASRCVADQATASSGPSARTPI
jgi:hypothetical protein